MKTKTYKSFISGEFDPRKLQELHKEEFKFIPTGYANIDKYCRLPDNGIVIISGRTNHGKSNFMQNLGLNIATGTKYSVLYLTLEMSVLEFNIRAVKILDGRKFSESGWEDDIEYDKHLKNLSTPAAKKYNELLMTRKFRIADSTVQINDIVDIMNLAKQDDVPLVVIVDYLQIIPLNSIGSTAARYERLKNMIELLRKIAVKNKQLLIGGSQLTAGESPLQDQVRESKDLEMTAALHLKVWNKEKAQTDAEKKMYENMNGDIMVVVQKARQNKANNKVFGFISNNGCRLDPVNNHLEELKEKN